MNKFIKYKEWLMITESKSDPYGCIMLQANMNNWRSKHLKIIDPSDLFEDDTDDYGYCSYPHITVLFGLHDGKINKKDLFEDIRDMSPVTVKIKEIDIFVNDKFDVVKYEIPVTEQLKEYNKNFLNNYSNTQTFPKYHPHMTLAYVKPGEGKKYVQKVKPFELIFNKAIYSYPDTPKKYFKLK